MTFALKPQAPFERLRLANDCPEVALNKAIILQAMIDASNTSRCRSAQKIAKEARKWLFGNSEGFIEVCTDGELNPNFVTNLVGQIIGL
jgi:hypothetical protein